MLLCQGALAVLVGALAIGLLPAGRRGDPVAWCKGGLLLLGLAVHAPAEVRLAGADDTLPAPIDLTVGLAVTPLVLTGLLLLVTGLLGRRAERLAASRDTAALVHASGVTAAAFAAAAVLLGSLLVTGASAAGLPPGWVATVGADLARLGLGALLVALAGTALGRAAVRARAAGVPSALDLLAGTRPGWARDLRQVRNLVLGAFLATLAALAVAALVALVHAALVASTLDPSTAPPVARPTLHGGPRQVVGGLVGLVAMLPGLVVLAAGLALGGPVGVTLDESGHRLLATLGLQAPPEPQLGLLAGGLPGRAYLVWLPLLAVSALAGLRAELARVPAARAEASAWRVPLLTAAVWALLAFLAQVSVRVQGSGPLLDGVPGITVTAGLQVGGVAVAALLWASVSVGAGRLLTRAVAAALPGPAARLGGSRLDHEWRLLLADAVLVRGGRMPASLEPSARALRAGARPAAPPLRTSPVRDRVLVVAALAATVVLLAGAGVRTVADDTVLGPAATVRAYAARLAAHDAAGALALVEPGSSGPLLTDAGTPHPPSAVRVLAVRTHGDRATVEVDEEIDGTTVPATLRLRRHTQKGLFARWLLDQPFTRLRVPLEGIGGVASIDGVAIGSDSTALVFPGRHTVARASAGLFAAASADVAVVGSGEQEAPLTATLAPDADAVAAAAVRRHLDECAASGPVVPDSCPFQSESGVEDARWTVVRYPVVNAVADGDGVSVGTITPGEVLLTGTTTDAYGYPAPYTERAPLDVRGTLTWPGSDARHATFVPEQP